LPVEFTAINAPASTLPYRANTQKIDEYCRLASMISWARPTC